MSLAERIRSTASVEEIDAELTRLHEELTTVQGEIDFLKTTRRIITGEKPPARTKANIKPGRSYKQPDGYEAPAPGVALVDEPVNPLERVEIQDLLRAMRTARNQTPGQLAVKIQRTEAETLALLKSRKDLFTVYAGAWRIR